MVNKTALIVGGIAVVGVVGYFLLKKRGTDSLNPRIESDYKSGVSGEEFTATQPTIRTDIRQTGRTQRAFGRQDVRINRADERTNRTYSRQETKQNRADERTTRATGRQEVRTGKIQGRQEIRATKVQARIENRADKREFRQERKVARVENRRAIIKSVVSRIKRK